LLTSREKDWRMIGIAEQPEQNTRKTGKIDEPTGFRAGKKDHRARCRGGYLRKKNERGGKKRIPNLKGGHFDGQSCR